MDLALRDAGFEVAAALTLGDDPACGSSLQAAGRTVRPVSELETECDVLVDFTVAAGTVSWLSVCERRGIPMVIGATGHDDDQLLQIERAAAVIPIVKASNFSIGINVILSLVKRLAEGLGGKYDIEIVEAHHRHKVDAPSGTALALLKELRTTVGACAGGETIYGREGHTGERPYGQIGVHALRMGELVGRHEIHFSGPGETVTLQHTAHSRETFAAGALRAAEWIVSRRPGLYSMQDVMA